MAEEHVNEGNVPLDASDGLLPRHPEGTAESLARIFARRRQPREPGTYTRAEVLALFLAAVGGAVVGIDQLPRAHEVIWPTSTETIFKPEQKARARRKDVKSAAVIFGPITVGNPAELGTEDALTSEDGLHSPLERFGPVCHMRYSNAGLDSLEVASAFINLHEEYGIEEITGFFESTGFQNVAEGFYLAKLILKRRGKNLKLKHAILDGTPLSIYTTRYPGVGEPTKKIDPLYDGGAILRYIADTGAYGLNNNFRPGTASAGLLWDQLVNLVDGEDLVRLYLSTIAEDETQFAFLTPEHSGDDKVIDPDASINGLQRVLKVSISRRPVIGAKSHANPVAYREQYWDILNALADEWELPRLV